MRVDISEIKTFRQCPRKWQLSSRNAYHLRPTTTPRHFTFGTIFHEALHQLYLGADRVKVIDWVRSQIDTENNPGEAALVSMVQGYIDNLLDEDLERYQILEVEHHFEIPLHTNLKVNLCGSIDMIAIDKQTGGLVGFEHKTCKNFRSGAYLALDDQLRVYNWVLFDIAQHHPDHPTVDGIILNETKKLLRKFENHREVHKESWISLESYINSLRGISVGIVDASMCLHIRQPQPCADFLHCQMCEFNTICETYGGLIPEGNNGAKAEILQEFDGEFMERECDHLDEKVEREVIK